VKTRGDTSLTEDFGTKFVDQWRGVFFFFFFFFCEDEAAWSMRYLNVEEG
jgi:hypothetical protein